MDDFSYLNSRGASMGGEPLTKKMSSSHVMPSKLEDYQNFFRQSSNREDGYLDIRFGRGIDSKWERKWVVFEDSILYFGDSPTTPMDECQQVAMDTVISVRTDIYETRGTTLIVVSTLLCKIYMKAKSTVESRRWLFCFQKSVALVLLQLLNEKTAYQQDLIMGHVGIGGGIKRNEFYNSDIVERTVSPNLLLNNHHNNTSSISSAKSAEEAKKWLYELGHGHGKHSVMVMQRSSFKDKDFKKMLNEAAVQASGNVNSSSSKMLSPSKNSNVSGFESLRNSRNILSTESFNSEGSTNSSTGSKNQLPSHISNVDLTQLYRRETGEVLYGSNSPKSSSSSAYTSGMSRSLSSTSQFMSYFNTKARPAHQQDPVSPSGSLSNGKTSSTSILKQPSPLSIATASALPLSSAIPIVSSSGVNSSRLGKALPLTPGGTHLLDIPVHDPGFDNTESYDEYAAVIGHNQTLAGSYSDKNKTVLNDVLVEERLRELSHQNQDDMYGASGDEEVYGSQGTDYYVESRHRPGGSGSQSHPSVSDFQHDDSTKNTPRERSSSRHAADGVAFSLNDDSYMMFDMEDDPRTPLGAHSTHSMSSAKSAALFAQQSQALNSHSTSDSNVTESSLSSGSGVTAARDKNTGIVASGYRSTNTVNTSSGSGIRSSQLQRSNAIEIIPSFAAVALDIMDNSNNNNNSTHDNNRHGTSNLNSSRLNTHSNTNKTSAAPSLLSTSLLQSTSQSYYASSSSSQQQQRPSTLTWESGYCTILGPRSKNEDRLVALPNLLDDITVEALPYFVPSSTLPSPPVRQGYFAVYDGHCGEEASSYLQRIFHTEVCAHPAYYSNINVAITETCAKIDSEFLQLCADKKMNCGTTALGIFIRDTELTVYNIGDCSAVLAASNGCITSLSDAHKPHRKDERERIMSANGWITEEQELYMGRLHRMDLTDPLVRDMASQVKFVTIYRVCGDLAVTRSIGDPDYKNIVAGALVKQWFQWPEAHDKIFHGDLIIPTPEIVNVALSSQDEFLIVASDGLWDVISSADAVAIVRDNLYKNKNKSVSQVAEELCELALRLGSSDNVSVVIVQFIH